MDFPAYVPAAVRAHITTLLDGDDWEPRGWNKALKEAEDSLAKIEAAIEIRARRGEVEYLDSLRKQKVEAIEHRDELVGYVNSLYRLARDERMQDAYAKLTQEFTQDEQWRGFIQSAWAAGMGYSKYRERLKRAAELRDKIADTSEKLAKLLRSTADTGGSVWPSEFFSVPELLRETDSHKMQNHNLHMWRSMRKHVLGDPPICDIPDSKRPQEQIGAADIQEITIQNVKAGEKPVIDQQDETRNVLRYTWGTAPSFSELLDTVARAAREFQPSESGMIGAAIKSRQQSRAENKEYLRAFGNQLAEVRGFPLTINIMKAMADVATVVINDRDFIVSYDDVVKAIGKPVETRD